MDIMTTLLSALPGAVAQGLIWGIMAIGVYVTFRVLDIADLTVDGTMCTGAAVCIMMMLAGHNVIVSLIVATLAGMAAGLLTGIFHTFMGIPAILAGILTQLSLYSINLKIMTKANQSINVDNSDLLISLRFIKGVAFYKNTIFIVAVFIVATVAILYWFFGTELGSMIRATGINEAMVKAQGGNTEMMKIIGLVIANGFVALSGALVAQIQRYGDVGMGTGTIVIGLASIIIGEVLLGRKGSFKVRLLSVFLGSILYRVIIAIVLLLGFNPNNLKLLTALLVIAALSIPVAKEYTGEKKRTRANLKKYEGVE